jgi:hypothetical protein
LIAAFPAKMHSHYDWNLHAFLKTTELNLVPPVGQAAVTPAAPGSALPANVYTVDVLMANASIPAEPTSYQCVHVQLPSDKKYHIVAQEVRLYHVPVLLEIE